MVVLIHNCFRYCKTKTILVNVTYAIYARLLNLTTIIYVMDVDLLNRGKMKNHWFIRFLVSINKA